MQAPITIRCSSLDRVLACAGSLEHIDAPYTPNNPEAREGTAAHEALRSIPLGEDPDIDGIAARYDVDADTLRLLVSRGRQAWHEVGPWFGGEREADSKRYEAALGEGILLRGTPDLLAVQREAQRLATLSILDWKAGWAPSEHPHQLRGYARLALAEHGMPSSGYILGVEVWVRVGEMRVHRFSAEDLERLDQEVIAQVAQSGKQYGPSVDACRYCPLQNSCSARADWLRSGVTALEPVAANAAVTPELLGALYERRKQLGVALSRYDDALKEALERGPVPLPDGRQLVIEEKEQDKLVPSRAMRFLRDELRLAPHEADEVLSVSKTGLERVLKGRVPRGKGAGAMREAMKRLEEFGAVEKTTKRATKVVKGGAS